MADYVNLIKKAFEYKIPQNEIYPSELGVCLRKSWFFRKFPSAIREFNEAMDIGIVIHEAVEKVFENEMNCKSELTLDYNYKGYKISARIDLLCGKDLLELKTSSHLLQKPYEHHIYQVSLYYDLLKKQNYDIQNVFIFYITRDTREIQQFRINNEMLNEYIKKSYEFIDKMIESLKIEDFRKIEGRNDKLCNSCQFFNICKVKPLF